MSTPNSHLNIRQRSREFRRRTAMAKINAKLCFECQSTDGRALRRLDSNNRDLLICKKCAIPCHRCQEELREGRATRPRCEFINATSIVDNACEAEESLCREHWGMLEQCSLNDDHALESDEDVAAPESDEDVAAPESDDDVAAPDDRLHEERMSSSRPGWLLLLFNWDSPLRRGYSASRAKPEPFDIEDWEWRKKSEVLFEENEVSALAEALACRALDMPDLPLPNAKRVAT